MDVATLRQSFGSCTPEEVFLGCRATLEAEDTARAAEVLGKLTSYQEAVSWLSYVTKRFLDADKYRQAMHLLWGLELFDPRPRCVARMLNAIESHPKVIILGSSAMGKSYSVIAWLLMDWVRDPEYTGVKVLSATGKHALAHTFSSLQRFHQEAIIPLPGLCQHGFIGMSRKDMHASLEVISIQQNQTGRQTLQGFHPIRRRKPHPLFGPLSRIRIFLDEAELIPDAVWRGVQNLLSSKSGKDTVKVICAANPWDVTSKLAANAEPPKGWNNIDIDKDVEWNSRTDFKTLRLDAAFSENVQAGKEIYHGLATPEGYAELQMKGPTDPNFICYGRGMYPLQGTIDQLIPRTLLTGFFGQFIFQAGTDVVCGGVDIGDSGDDSVLFAAHYGRAERFIPAGASAGEAMYLEEPRYVLQLDQFRTLTKGLLTEDKFFEIKRVAEEFGILPPYDWLAIDSTGYGKSVLDLFVRRGFSPMGIGWGTKATHSMILEEHRNFADELYTGVHAEMYFALRYWMETGFIKCNPNVDMTKLDKEMTGRKRKRSGGLGPTGEPLYTIEEKKDFKARLGFSPDRCDALVMALHIARQKGPERAQIARKRKPVVPVVFEGEEVFQINKAIDWSE